MLGRLVVVGSFVVGLALASVVGCGGPPPPPATPAPRTSIARRELPAEIQPLVPRRGVYLAGGGEKSEVFRVVVDTDAKTIYTGKGPAASPLHGTLPDQRTRELTPRNEEHLMRLCADAWAEPAPASAPDPVDGYDEFFIVADGDELFFVQGHGPIRRPKAVKAIEALRAAAAL